MIWTDSYVKILLINTKTDAYKTGQWCMILVSSLPHSAYQMLVRMVTYLCDSPAFKRSGINVSEAPIAMPFVTENNVRVPNPASRLTYDHVNNKLKAWCEKAGLSPSLFSTHSWKRGGINERVERKYLIASPNLMAAGAARSPLRGIVMMKSRYSRGFKLSGPSGRSRAGSRC